MGGMKCFPQTWAVSSHVISHEKLLLIWGVGGEKSCVAFSKIFFCSRRDRDQLMVRGIQGLLHGSRKELGISESSQIGIWTSIVSPEFSKPTDVPLSSLGRWKRIEAWNQGILSATLRHWSVWRSCVIWPVSELVFPDITKLADNVVSLPTVLLFMGSMSKSDATIRPVEKQGIGKFHSATQWVSEAHPMASTVHFPKLDWRPEYCCSQNTSFNTISRSSLQTSLYLGSCLAHFFQDNKNSFF